MEYNSYRPHSSVEGLTPDEFVEKHLAKVHKTTLLGVPSSGHMPSSAKENVSSRSSEDICPDEGLETTFSHPVSPV